MPLKFPPVVFVICLTVTGKYEGRKVYTVNVAFEDAYVILHEYT